MSEEHGQHLPVGQLRQPAAPPGGGHRRRRPSRSPAPLTCRPPSPASGSSTSSTVTNAAPRRSRAVFTDDARLPRWTTPPTPATSPPTADRVARRLHHRWTGDVPVGETATVTLLGDGRHQPPPATRSSPTRLASTSVPRSHNCLAGSTDPRCTSAVTIAALVIQQCYAETTTTPGSMLHLTATFANIGAAAYDGITITSPSAGTVDDAIPTGDQTRRRPGTLVLSATAITWTGNIAGRRHRHRHRHPDRQTTRTRATSCITGTLVSTLRGATAPQAVPTRAAPQH